MVALADKGLHRFGDLQQKFTRLIPGSRKFALRNDGIVQPIFSGVWGEKMRDHVEDCEVVLQNYANGSFPLAREHGLRI